MKSAWKTHREFFFKSDAEQVANIFSDLYPENLVKVEMDMSEKLVKWKVLYKPELAD